MTRIRVRLSDEELAQLALLAQKLDLSWNLTVRMAPDYLADSVRAAKLEDH
jgi:hypothetical protein